MFSARPIPWLLLLGALAFVIFAGYLPARREATARAQWEESTRTAYGEQVRSWLAWVARTARRPDPEERSLLIVTPLVEAESVGVPLYAVEPEGHGRDWIDGARRLVVSEDTTRLVRAQEMYELAISFAAPGCRKIALFENASLLRRLGRISDALLLDAQLLEEFGRDLARFDRCTVLARRVDSLIASNELASASELSLELFEALLPLRSAQASDLRRRTLRRLRAWAAAESPPFPALPELVESLELRGAVQNATAGLPVSLAQPLAVLFDHRGTELLAVVFGTEQGRTAAVLEKPAFPLALPASEAGDEPLLATDTLALGVLLPVYLAIALLFLQSRRERRTSARLLAFARQLKTPVARLHALGETLGSPGLDPTRIDAYVRAVGREAERLARPIANVLELAHFEEEKKPYRFESVDVGGLLDEVADRARARLAGPDEGGERGLRVECTSSAQVQGDGRALALALSNLVDLLAGASSGEVVLSAAPRGSRVTLSLTAAAVDLGALEATERGEGSLGLTVAALVLGAHGGSPRWERDAAHTRVSVELATSPQPETEAAAASLPSTS